jgi:late competence protein required for DNA uptake (superfamily II DNA/RNA helicase)
MMIMSSNEDPQIQNKKIRCQKCRGFNTWTVGKGIERSFYCLDCNYVEGM